MKKSSFFFVHDLNSFSLMGDHMHTFSAGDGYVCRSTCVLPSDDLFASEGLQSNGCSTTSATQSTRLHLFGPVPRFGFRSVDHTRVFARYRDQFACSKAAFLSYGPALQDHLEKHSGKRQSSEALGSFCGSRAPFDCNCTKALRQRTDQRRIQIPHGSDGICARFDDHRSVFESVQLGSISHRQSRRQTSYFDRLEGIDSQFYPHQRRQNARRQGTRYPLQARLHRGWRVLRDGQGLRRLCKIVSVAYRQSFLCDSDQRQPSSSVGSRVYCRYQCRLDQRSTCSLDWIELRQAISRSSSMRSIYRSRIQQNLGISHQQLCIASDHNLCAVQTKMAGRVVLQVDQTAPSNQIFLRNDRKRSQDTGVDRHIHLRADRHYEKETEFAAFALRNSQSFGSQHV